ncbi:MAG: glutamine--fructose-6-phosphate transaminase (isomerizing) [Elusimicrobium sp.]|jgi:glucosamine--fructose-6-phosphate aminotransferase (isomerizing)|nr:glutamine--fructose-6-phosphate transaminase (isomerizing) [Elusimicrobium sp.]
MCGIIGYAGKKPAAPYIIQGLKNLEYRGYDSAGIAVIQGGRLLRLRAAGKVSALETLVSKANFTGTAALGHTRWATHGKPSEINSHPHTDCSGKLAVVHNGIIENYLTLKEELKKKKHVFRSETDTEVIAHLIEENLKTENKNAAAEKRLLVAVQKTVKQITGAFAVGVIWSGAPDAIIGARKQSPLAIGLGKGENFIASDAAAFLKHTKKAVFLEDNEIALVSSYGVKFYGADGIEKNPAITDIKWSHAQAEKSGYEHFMLKEIFEQPQAAADTLLSCAGDMKIIFGADKNKAGKIKNIQILACGTAYHAAMSAKYFIEQYANVPVSADYASEYKYRSVPPAEGTLAIAVSQSGETADTIAAFKKAKNLGFKTLAICNVLGSTLTRLADNTFYTRCGPEISVASTKAYTSQLAALYGFALFLGRENGSLPEEKFKTLSKEFFSLPRLLEETAQSLAPAVKKTAKKFYRRKTFIFLARGVNYPAALEGALKLKEISYLHAEGFAGGEIKHGPIALIDKNVPVIALMPKDALFEKMLSACEETKARGARVIAVTDAAGAKILKGKASDILVIPSVTPFLTPVLNAVAVQLFAYYIAKLKGREIDQPRNLAKSVTVE